MTRLLGFSVTHELDLLVTHAPGLSITYPQDRTVSQFGLWCALALVPTLPVVSLTDFDIVGAGTTITVKNSVGVTSMGPSFGCPQWDS